MGSTYVEFRGRGFEASDATLEIWLLLLVEEIDSLPSRPRWLQDVREEWYIQATEVFGFGVMPGLDEVVTNEERRDVILDLSSRAMKRLRTYGRVISKDELNAILRGGPDHMFTEDARTEPFVRTGDYFTKLLREELAPEECDARFGPSPGT